MATSLPIMLTVAITYAVRVKISHQSIYTLKLHRRGSNDSARPPSRRLGHQTRSSNLMNRHFDTIDLADVAKWAQEHQDDASIRYALVTENGKIAGVLRRELGYLMADVEADKLIETSFTIVPAQMTWPALLRNMNENNNKIILVGKSTQSLASENILGVITYREIVKSSQQLAKLLS